MFIIFNFRVFYYSLIYLIITACEGALGLSILVILSRSIGGDYFKSFNIIINYDKIYFCFVIFFFNFD
jgi:NADH:ubiquinone oxidoreductase subunit K